MAEGIVSPRHRYRIGAAEGAGEIQSATLIALESAVRRQRQCTTDTRSRRIRVVEDAALHTTLADTLTCHGHRIE